MAGFGSFRAGGIPPQIARGGMSRPMGIPPQGPGGFGGARPMPPPNGMLSSIINARGGGGPQSIGGGANPWAIGTQPPGPKSPGGFFSLPSQGGGSGLQGNLRRRMGIGLG